MVHTQKGDREIKIVREFSAEKMIMTIYVDDTVARRFFKAVWSWKVENFSVLLKVVLINELIWPLMQRRRPNITEKNSFVFFAQTPHPLFEQFQNLKSTFICL